MVSENLTFKNQLVSAVEKYPSLCIKKDTNGHEYLHGTLDIFNDENLIAGSFMVEIHGTEKFPYRFPALYESGGDIPNEADWHKYANGSCCITVLPDEILQCKTSISVTSFIKNNAVSYFANHIHRKLTGVYKNGEFAHGLKGLEQFYTTLLKTNDNSLWLQYFEMTFKGKKIECHRNDPCICGSLLKYKICHLKVFQALQSLGDKIVLTHFKLITNET